MKLLFSAILAAFLLVTNSYAQGIKPNIFLDCQMNCNFNYVREQITFVNYMQNRQEADIYILATRQRTGAGGDEVQLLFQGNNSFELILDTLTYYIDPNATESIERDQFIKAVKKGLLPFLIESEIFDQLEYSISDIENTSEDNKDNDLWNYWVFNLGGNGWINGEQSYKRLDLSTRLSADRITNDNKFVFSGWYNFQENTFILSDQEEYTSILRSYNLYSEYVHSINDHWSMGGVLRSGSSTFGNTDLSTAIRGAIEYNIYPYKEAQTRRFSFFYSIGPEFYDYTEKTIYGKENEWTLRHSLTIQYAQTQKWGEIDLFFGYQQYFHDLNLYNAYLNPNIEWQIYKGLSLNFGGFFSFVTDRINIAQSEISDEDILLQIKQLDTDFTYHSYVGLNYRFGSKFNNFVNPRF